MEQGHGSSTVIAVADFQRWVNNQRNEQTLTVTGEVDQLTLSIYFIVEIMKCGHMADEAVRNVQRSILRRGDEL